MTGQGASAVGSCHIQSLVPTHKTCVRSSTRSLLGRVLAPSVKRPWVRLQAVSMTIGGLGAQFEGSRIAHISDLHCGMFVRPGHLSRYVEVVNALNADFIAVTGDLITTASRRHAREVAQVLSELRPRTASLACLGNHDYGLWHPKGLGSDDDIADFLSDQLRIAGVMVLRNETSTFRRDESLLQFVGVEDFWSRSHDPRKAFERVNPESPVIALAHNPDAAPQLAAMGADWILSGHTHGLATPKNWFWDIVYPTRHKMFVAGRYSLGRVRHLYVNRGIGNRRRRPPRQEPEITLFTMHATDIETRSSATPATQTQPTHSAAF